MLCLLLFDAFGFLVYDIDRSLNQHISSMVLPAFLLTENRNDVVVFLYSIALLSVLASRSLIDMHVVDMRYSLFSLVVSNF